MSKIGKKAKLELYGLIDNDIIVARIKINKLLEGNRQKDAIDSILYQLNISAPGKIYEYFGKDKNNE